MTRKPLALFLIWLVVTTALEPQEKFDQALKTSISDPYDTFLSFSIDDEYTLLQLRSDLLKNETMFSNFVATLKNDLPTRYLKVSLQPHDDYKVEDRFNSLCDSLENVQIEQVSYEESSSWRKYALIGGIIAVGAIATPLLVTASVGALGFTGAGIAANSVAAGIMSTYGGSVGVGSACALLQSVGAVGLSTVGTAFFSTVGGIFAGAGAKVVSDQFDKKDEKDSTRE